MDRDHKLMQRALDEARKGLGRTRPNPAVGALITKNGRTVSIGYHAKAGTPHAEVVALTKAGARAQGATMYSTLEPCNHTGRTGPCTEAIIKAGIARVVIGATDPNPLVSGRGIRRLRQAGLEVKVGVLEEACRDLNEPFNFAIVNRRPFVVYKLAASLDGRIATRTGDSKWITSDEARARGRSLRGKLDAIVVGRQTVVADDPRLTTRQDDLPNPLRVVFDSQARLPLKSHLVRTAPDVPTLLLTTRSAPATRLAKLEKAGLQIRQLRKTRKGQVDPAAALEALYAEGMLGVLLEGGPTLAGSFVDAGLVDKVVAYVEPMLIGGADARNALGGKGAGPLAQALRLERVTHAVIGSTLEITGYPISP